MVSVKTLKPAVTLSPANRRGLTTHAKGMRELTMETKIPAEGVPAGDLDILTEVVGRLSDERLAAGVRALRDQIANGSDVAVRADRLELSPQEAAKLLCVSRTFLIKLMDKGELAFHYVGKHRRVEMNDLRELQQRMHADTRHSAEEFAHLAQLESRAAGEISTT